MAIAQNWHNSYGSLLTLELNNKTGALIGTYASTTGGTGTYDVVGWCALNSATEAIGQPLCISILWRSNDGGKSDPSHEVSMMAGQLFLIDGAESLVLNHMFIETKAATTPALGNYPDKLVFFPYPQGPTTQIKIADMPTTQASTLPGSWSGTIQDKKFTLELQATPESATGLSGTICFDNGPTEYITGFTDGFAQTDGFARQGVTLSTFRNEGEERILVAMAGYLDLRTQKLYFNQFETRATSPDNKWYQTVIAGVELIKK